MKKKFLDLLAIIIVIVGIFSANFFLNSKFHANDCVEDMAKNIMYVNNFSLGKYHLMGWQGGSWGNAVEMEKSLLERTFSTGIPYSHRIECPEYNPFK